MEAIIKSTAFCSSSNIYKTKSQKPTMGNLVIGLRPHLCTYEQFVGHLCNVFKISNVRKSLWNGTQSLGPVGPRIWGRWGLEVRPEIKYRTSRASMIS